MEAGVGALAPECLPCEIRPLAFGDKPRGSSGDAYAVKRNGQAQAMRLPMNLRPALAPPFRKPSLHPRQRLINHRIALTEGKARVMRWRILTGVEGRHRNRGDLRFFRQRAAEGDIIAIEAKRAEIRGNEIGTLGRQHIKAKPREAGAKLVALRLQMGRKPVEIGIILHQPHGHTALQIGRRGEGKVLVRLGHIGRDAAIRCDVANLPAGQGKGLACAANTHAALPHAG